MTIDEIRKKAPKKDRLHEKVNLTKEQLSKIGLQQLNAYKSKRRKGNDVYIEL